MSHPTVPDQIVAILAKLGWSKADLGRACYPDKTPTHQRAQVARWTRGEVSNASAQLIADVTGSPIAKWFVPSS